MAYNEFMQSAQAQSYAQQYRESKITFNPYVAKKTGLLQTQTVLTLDTYALNCIPYQISMSQVILLGMLSSNEISFFQKYIKALGGLSLVFQRDGRQQALKIFMRCSVSQIAQMKGKEGVALLVLSLKNCPQDLVDIIGDYLTFLDRLRLQYDDFKDKMIQITPSTSKILEFNNFASISSGSDSLRIQLFSLSTNKAEFLSAPSGKEFDHGAILSMKLYFHKFQFSTKATVTQSARLPTGVIKTKVDLEFTPELIEIIDYYYFKARVQQRGA
jgi:hypothetical protein